MKYKVILIFFGALSCVILYSILWEKIFIDRWPNALSISEIPLIIIVAFIAPIIFLIKKKIPKNFGRFYLIYGFSGLLILILYVIAVEKYSFVFSQEAWIFNLHPLEPIFFTISVSFIIHGMAKNLNLKRVK